MTSKLPGVREIRRLLAEGALERRPAADVGADALMARADSLLASARAIVDSDAVTAYVIAYDAARHAGAALLARQNLRATARGGHVAVERALVAQFGDDFRDFRPMRRRRHELDYPRSAEDFADRREADDAIQRAADMVNTARHTLEHGSLSSF